MTATIGLTGGAGTTASININGSPVLPLGGNSPKWNDFRLTLTSGTPVTTSDVTGATTIYCTPYTGNIISLYNGSTWAAYASSEFSLALGTLTSGKPYDVFCYDNAGTPTLEFLVWTNDTTRATALAYQDGVLVKSGAATRRYLGTFYTTAATTTEDSATKRYLWNYYNRVIRPMKRAESTASWTYSTATLRQANNSASNQLEFIHGVAEDAVEVVVSASCSTSGLAVLAVGIGLDSTSANSGSTSVSGSGTGGEYHAPSSIYTGTPAAGRHYFAWLEVAQAVGTTTWYGATSSGGVPHVSEIKAKVLA